MLFMSEFLQGLHPIFEPRPESWYHPLPPIDVASVLSHSVLTHSLKRAGTSCITSHTSRNSDSKSIQSIFGWYFISKVVPSTFTTNVFCLYLTKGVAQFKWSRLVLHQVMFHIYIYILDEAMQLTTCLRQPQILIQWRYPYSFRKGDPDVLKHVLNFLTNAVPGNVIQGTENDNLSPVRKICKPNRLFFNA